MTATTAIVGLGSNLGSREALIREAIRLLDDTPELDVEARSRLYVTAPIGPPQPDFLNAAVLLRTGLEPGPLLARLLEVEARLGRVRTVRWGARTVDLDLLWWSGGRLDAPELTLPHPRMSERAFALAPLLDVAPQLSPLYGAALERSGGPPPTRRWAEMATTEGGLTVEASDDADALALASGAWAAHRDGLERVEAPDPSEFVHAGGRVILAWKASVIRGLGGGGGPVARVTVGGGRCTILAGSRV